MTSLEFNQASAFLTAVQAQVTGAAASTTITPQNFVSVATTTLNTGFDTVMNAVSQVLGRTIMSVRPYYAKFPGMMSYDPGAWGNHTRKIQFVDKALDSTDDKYAWPVGYDANSNPADGTGQSVDMFAIKKAQPLQTNFYGSQVYQDHITVFQDQLQQAFKGPEDMNAFVSGMMTEWSNKLAQYEEDVDRGLIVNHMAALIDEANTDRVVHLLTEYNLATGLSLTSQTVKQPANFPGFVKWAYSRINTISDFMTERSQMYQTNITNFPINRHTPKSDQRLYIHSPNAYEVQASVLADVFNEGDLTVGEFERVNFWQTISDPAKINCTPVYTDNTGAEKVAGSAVTQDDVFGILCDRDAFGAVRTQFDMVNTVLNPRGMYSNLFLHATYKTYEDMTEKSVIFLLD